MSKKTLNSKLENLFAGLNGDESPSSELISGELQPLSTLIKWIWNTDPNGIVVECSREIMDVLGFSSSDVIGQPIFSFGLAFEEQQKIRNLINKNIFPIDLDLEYQTKSNKRTLVKTNIEKIINDSGVLTGYHVISQNKITDSEQTAEKSEAVALEENEKELEKPDVSHLKSSRLYTRPLLDSDSVENLPLQPVENVSPKSEKPKIIKPRKASGPAREKNTVSLGNTAPLSPTKLVKPLEENNIQRFPETITGISLSNEQFQNANSVWTEQAVSSYTNNQIVVESGSSHSPAVIAFPLKLRDQKTGIVEIVDTQKNRKWTLEEQLLVQEVTNQLGLALENAQLYSAVQKELGERVKAEAETVRRNKELAKLNLLMQQLTRLVSRQEIFEIVSSSIQDLMNVDNLLISIFDPKQKTLSFPICVSDGEFFSLPDRQEKGGYQEQILKTRSTLLANENIKAKITDAEIDHPNHLPLSLLAVPLLSGDRALGVISVFNYDNENAFEEVQVELLSTVAAQFATALENANLFQEIRQALETIEVRERYQANVTNAVASLSEKGSSSVEFMLESLALASKCDRVSYEMIDETHKDTPLWKTTSEFVNPGSEEYTRRLAATNISLPSEWITFLSEKGYFFSTQNNAKKEEKSFFESRGIQSVLLLGLSLADGYPNFLMLENTSVSYDWKLEEINILRIASDAFRNTLVREGLLKQVQTSLNETENLYTASHQLALSNSIPDMVAAIVKGIDVPAINRGVLVLFTYGSDGTISKMAVEANYHNGIGTPPAPIGTEYLESLYKPIFQITDPVFYDDLLEVEMDNSLRNVLTRQNIRSMAILPLWSGNNQLGVLLLQSGQKHIFGPQEARSYPPLVDQMSTAIENLRLFEQTQDALAETGLLYTVTSGISRATKLAEFVTLIGENALPKNADTLWLLSAKQHRNNQPDNYEVIGSFNTQRKLLTSIESIDSEIFDFLDFSNPEAVTNTDIRNSELSEHAKSTFEKLNLASASFIPLQISSTPVGIIITGSKRVTTFDPDDIHTLQIVGNSVAVAIERQRLLFEAQRRALELQTAAEIARDTTSTLSLDILLSRIVSLLKDRFEFYHCSIFLLDESGKYASIEESTGEAGLEMKRHRYQFAVGSKSVIGTCTATGEPVLVEDVSNSPIFTRNPLLPETRSELGLPMKISGKVIGAIDLQSSQIEAFSGDVMTVLQILADQVAVAIDNARAYEISQRAVEEMRELDRVKSQFLANMSHELRTPLNSVIGFSRVILKGIDGPINDVQEQDITAIYNSGMHLLNMINEILDLSKIEAGKMELQIDEVSLNDVINSAITTSTGLVKDKPIELIQKVPANLPLIQADEIRLSQVLINLISNAVKFTEKGSITIEASVRNNTQNNPEIMVTVTDTGMGIALEDQSKLFQRFSQVDDSPTRKTGGTGLGLSICRSFIEMHGGKIGLLSSEIGKGSVFYFTLPLPEGAEIVNLDHLIHGKNIVLSIDDDAQVISLYERFLKTHGYEVIALTDPTLAVQRARELKPFAITLDIMMPNKDGWQVLNDLKKDEETRNIPIMICSILEEEEKGFNLGASEYLVKPFLQDDLINAIHRLNKDGEIHEVLIVDDDPTDLRLLKKMIDDSGKYITVIADSGLSAMSLLKDFTPDIIILDLFMPGINGFELLEKFKIDPRLNNIPVIVLTGADLSKEQHSILSDFGSQILTKGSLGEQDLLQNLQQMLSKIRPAHLVN